MPTSTLPAQPDHPIALSAALKAHTRAAHDRLDQHLLQQHIFASRQRYLCFLRVQWHFHSAVAPLYRMQDPGATRLPLIEEDLRDLGASMPAPHAWQPQPHVFSKATVLGWRYVAEGSTLGAAVLLKMAAALQLHAGYGARHLRPSNLGVAEYWRREREELDALVLSGQERAQACRGATDAFQYIRRCVDEEFRFE
ncbi:MULTISPECIES: biliverdin-producing heme oxygenase [Stenotrophomonas]|uniref:biliverdin-producing heme oxygenase n=1 Tax=Stenotrophomonas TaxID=40323 RepID=UPI00065843D1|nr:MULTISPECIES: biliverdin-producing heme oxygenase [Stenotrophomonas maltophilia group]CRR21381.1 Heme oxygenase [Pseudomonas aeruginosa]MCU1054633.1 biliverdin-producing heme oxygenase [Stenotrophomonas maltophilia]OBU53610.1 hypothetical protein A9K69_09910 [Stenotrophomonas maltophilia]OBU58959.1 hypothetical protein A9K70_00110 [Stenotrophomonas maltophilia]OBU65454.1 hypothetical protein A9J40_11970 [Stenotrophomonas maltophilia]